MTDRLFWLFVIVYLAIALYCWLPARLSHWLNSPIRRRYR